MHIIKILAVLFMLVQSATATYAFGQESGVGRAQSEMVVELARTQQELDHYKTQATELKWALGILTAVYVFVYIMGRRRLTRMIFVRNRAIRMALKKAEDSDRQKSEFIRDMSAEVRTPLNAISGFAQLLCNEDFDLTDEDRQEMKVSIEQNVDRITASINKLRDMAEQQDA